MEKRVLKTLERVISKAGLGSRTQARSWIGQGRVRVNGREIQNPDHWIDLDRDKVHFDGKPLRAARKRYISPPVTSRHSKIQKAGRLFTI
jgi:16S rRNA U516 pseudouridylate synthase RsuA-like enzyme